jgi:hypothetical protein
MKTFVLTAIAAVMLAPAARGQCPAGCCPCPSAAPASSWAMPATTWAAPPAYYHVVYVQLPGAWSPAGSVYSSPYAGWQPGPVAGVVELRGSGWDRGSEFSLPQPGAYAYPQAGQCVNGVCTPNSRYAAQPAVRYRHVDRTRTR